MQVVFSFDTECFINPRSNDALLALAESHTRHGVRACFGVVGEKARFLRRCGRHDVIEAVARHEVGYHSDNHFQLPDHDCDQIYLPEYLEKQPWARGMKRLLAEEARGVSDVAETFGRAPVTWLRNYADYAAQYSIAMARLGVGVHAYGPPYLKERRLDDDADYAPIWSCNQLVVANPRLMYENNLHKDMTAQEKLDEHKKNFLRHLEGGTRRLGFVTHPTRFVSDIWSPELMWHGNPDFPHRREWQAPPDFSDEKMAELLWIADEFIEFVSELNDVEPVVFEDFWKRHRPTRQWLTREETLRLAEAVVRDGLACQALGDEWFSPAEVFAALSLALLEPQQDEIPVRRIIGPVEEPVETPPGLRPLRGDFLTAVAEAEYELRDTDAVPASIALGAGRVGPGGLLVAMADALVHPDADRVELPPLPNLPRPLRPDDYDLLTRGLPARLVQKDNAWDYPNMIRWTQLQYWTVKPA